MPTDATKVEMGSITSGFCCLALFLLGGMCVITLLALFITPDDERFTVWRVFCDLTTLFFLAFIAYHVARWRSVI
jgi:hypothetical protein